MKRTGADIIIELIKRQGITTVAGIPGGANLPLYDALAKDGGLRHVLARHEQGAGFIAQGMARVSGRPAVCLATSGPGATNVLTALADAKLDSVPVVCITGQVPLSMIGTDAFQEVDTFGMSMPLTKHNYLVRSAAELLAIVPEAFRIAMSGRPGPVLIDVPKDVQRQEVEFAAWPQPAQPDPWPAPPERAIARAAGMIHQSKRPILYVGGGVIQSGAGAAVRALAEKNTLPVTMTLQGLGILPPSHPLALGMLGMHAARFTNLALEECDLLIALGVRFDDRATGKVAEFCPRARVIHVDIDASELHKIRPAQVAIRGDVGTVLQALIPLIEPDDRPAWRDRIEALRRDHPLRMEAAESPRSPYGVIRAVARSVGPGAVVTTDVGQHQMWAAQAYPLERPRQWLTSGGLGTMGFGLPAAIGAWLAEPERKVVCFSGDGSLLMNIQELATAAELNADVKVVLLNNNSLGLVHQQQDLFYEGRRIACDYGVQVDFRRVAEGFGVAACDLGSAADPEQALAEALRRPGPCLIHVPIQASQKVFPMVPPGAANRDMIDAVS